MYKTFSGENLYFMKSIFTKKDVIYNRRTSNLLTLPKINTKRFGLYSFGFRSSHLRNQPPDCSFILYNYVLFNVVYKQEKETLLIRIQIENEISYQPFTFSCMVTYQLNQILPNPFRFCRKNPRWYFRY